MSMIVKRYNSWPTNVSQHCINTKNRLGIHNRKKSIITNLNIYSSQCLGYWPLISRDTSSAFSYPSFTLPNGCTCTCLAIDLGHWCFCSFLLIFLYFLYSCILTFPAFICYNVSLFFNLGISLFYHAAIIFVVPSIQHITSAFVSINFNTYYKYCALNTIPMFQILKGPKCPKVPSLHIRENNNTMLDGLCAQFLTL